MQHLCGISVPFQPQRGRGISDEHQHWQPKVAIQTPKSHNFSALGGMGFMALNNLEMSLEVWAPS